MILQLMKIIKPQLAAHANEVRPWQLALAGAVTSLDVLLSHLNMMRDQVNVSDIAAKQFALRVPHAFLSRMSKGDPNDPLLRQVLPLGEEMASTENFIADPLSEQEFKPVPGLLHKYKGRVLVVAVGSCAVNCRYCFRRHFPYRDNLISDKNWENILNYISRDLTINEVIFSGGDPLVIKDHHLLRYFSDIDSIQHIKRIRIHTRLPIVIPERMDNNFFEMVSGISKKFVMVLHSNHANEIDDAVGESVSAMLKNNMMVLNQSVLLRDINDSVNDIVQLSEKLFDVGVMPYYLHMLDKVQGAAHFEVSEEKALRLMDEVRNHLPGFLVPTLVREVPHFKSKSVL